MQGDIADIQRQAEQLLVVARQLPAEALSPDSGLTAAEPIFHAYRDLMRIAFFHAPDSMTSIAKRAKQDLAWYRTYQTIEGNRGTIIDKANIDFRSLSAEATINVLAPYLALWTNTSSAKISPLRADFWFQTGPYKVQPSPGQVTLLVIGDDDYRSETSMKVRRLMAQYGSRGFAVVMVNVTKGWIDYGRFGQPSPVRGRQPRKPSKLDGIIKIMNIFL